jgi:hypothetical protein
MPWAAGNRDARVFVTTAETQSRWSAGVPPTVRTRFPKMKHVQGLGIRTVAI